MADRRPRWSFGVAGPQAADRNMRPRKGSRIWLVARGHSSSYTRRATPWAQDSSLFSDNSRTQKRKARWILHQKKQITTAWRSQQPKKNRCHLQQRQQNKHKMIRWAGRWLHAANADATQLKRHRPKASPLAKICAPSIKRGHLQQRQHLTSKSRQPPPPRKRSRAAGSSATRRAETTD